MILRRFLDANRRLSRRLERSLPQAQENLYDRYERTVAEYIDAKPGQLVADVGAGRSSRFARHLSGAAAAHLVGVDISEEELCLNPDLNERRVADVTRGLPFADGEVDLLVSRSVVEHLSEAEPFVREIHRVLKPGGVTIHIFPNRMAPFALINRSLPHRLSQRVLYFFQPHAVDDCGFHAYYDACSPDRIVQAMTHAGLAVEECRLSYYQSRYYDFFFPAFAASALYERVVEALGLRSLCAYVLVIARKPA